MALIESNSFQIGEKAPDFTLFDTISGKNLSLENLKGEKGTAIFFICNHCPFVLHINEELVQMANEYQAKGIQFIAISSNDVGSYPQDGPDKMKDVAVKLKYSFPYLYDETQEIAKAYDATCTPDIYLFDSALKATYHGQLCDSRPGNGIPVTGKDFRHAMDELLKGNAPVTNQKASIGCSIKWK
jgi:peroxiredoxin|tara:strand:+ start:7137 stop:7691 length:555 start_codon:yes stop_codon:yes gene_type:complete